jgi:uncharacterized protein (DUF433 family)
MMIDIYGGKDPRLMPSYSAADASRYLKIPSATIRAWMVGYRRGSGQDPFHPLLEASQPRPLRLSFINLIEVHVLRAIRQHHRIDLHRVRIALDYINQQFQIPHPLAHQEFHTDGVDLFIEKYGQLINASQQGQLHLKATFQEHLERIEPDDSGLAIKLYPFTRNDEAHNPRIVVIDPRIAFGRLAIADRGIPVDIIAERFHAGDSPAQIADDYECQLEQVIEAIRCETRPIAA